MSLEKVSADSDGKPLVSYQCISQLHSSCILSWLHFSVAWLYKETLQPYLLFAALVFYLLL